VKINKTGIRPIYSRASGAQTIVAFEARARLGTPGALDYHADRKRFSPETSYPVMQEWRARCFKLWQKGGAAPGSLAEDCKAYQRQAPIDARTTAETLKRRKQQHDFWCAQSAKLGAPVLSVAQVQAGAQADAKHGPTLGTLSRRLLQPARLREILTEAFKPTDEKADPFEFASTSNHYRTALMHLYSVLDVDDPEAPNPIAKVPTRASGGPQIVGQDMRIIREILKHVPTKYGREGAVSEKRLAVLALVPITPVQLMRLDPAKDFRDIADADREAMIAGQIALSLRPRLKGQRKRRPAPELEPLTPYGVEAMRAFAAEPKAWGDFSTASLNKAVKGAARRAQAALAAKGIRVDLSGFTLYQLKHSYAAAMQVASGGITDAAGTIRIHPGVQKTLGHAAARTSATYTIGAIEPIKLIVSSLTAQYLDALFAQPLKATPSAASGKLRRVK
jgi:integrase